MLRRAAGQEGDEGQRHNRSPPRSAARPAGNWGRRHERAPSAGHNDSAPHQRSRCSAASTGRLTVAPGCCGGLHLRVLPDSLPWVPVPAPVGQPPGPLPVSRATTRGHRQSPGPELAQRKGCEDRGNGRSRQCRFRIVLLTDVISPLYFAPLSARLWQFGLRTCTNCATDNAGASLKGQPRLRLVSRDANQIGNLYAISRTFCRHSLSLAPRIG